MVYREIDGMQDGVLELSVQFEMLYDEDMELLNYILRTIE